MNCTCEHRSFTDSYQPHNPLCPVHGDPRDNSMRVNAPERPQEAQQRPQQAEAVSSTTDTFNDLSAPPAAYRYQAQTAQILEHLIMLCGMLEPHVTPSTHARFVRLMAEAYQLTQELKESK